MTKTFSLIVPFFAPDIISEAHATPTPLMMLSELIRSIPTRNDIEILICPDRTLIPATFLKEHPGWDIKVIADDGTPMAGPARNRGIMGASGRWLLFADSDDRFTAEMEAILEEVSRLSDEGPDCVYFHITSFENGRPDGSGSRSHYGEKMLRIAERDSIRGPLTNIFTPYGRVVRKALVDTAGLRFGLGRVANDLPFGVDVAIAARDVMILPHAGYSIRHRDGSLDSLSNPENIICRMTEKRSANGRLDQAGCKAYRLPLVAHHIELLKCSPIIGLRELGKSFLRRDQVLPQVWRLRERRNTPPDH